VTPFVKKLLAATGACLIAGLLTYKALSSIVGNLPNSADDVTPAAAQTSSSTASTTKSNTHASAPTGPQTEVGWLFQLKASAQDDPETARSIVTSIQFMGEEANCTPPSPRTQIGLAVDRNGGAVRTARAGLYCVPGCGGVPPVPVTSPLPRHIDVTAYQDEFDRAPGEYAPEGRITTVEWRCGGRTTRLTAAAMVALACNSDSCDDTQVANAGAYLNIESGRQLDSTRALFRLHGATGANLVGVAERR
jgi:hypothetical protein